MVSMGAQGKTLALAKKLMDAGGKERNNWEHWLKLFRESAAACGRPTASSVPI